MSEQGRFAPLGYSDVPAGKLANVVTCLQTHERPALRPEARGLAFRLDRLGADADAYRSLFRRVGTPYLWGSRLEAGDDELRAILRDPDVPAYALRDAGETACGMLELDFRTRRECEIRFFGVTAPHVGTGAARWLMNRAIELAWARPIERFWLHTCTLDHPNAIAFYIRSGFVPYKREIEVCDDPRVTGLLPRDAAPAVPIL